MNDNERIESLVSACNLLSDAMQAEREERRKTRRIAVICSCVCVVFALLCVGSLAVLAAGIQIETAKTETTEETTVTQETSGEGDAVYQAGDGAKFYADGKDGD